MPQLGLRKSQAQGHPKAQCPLSFRGCGDQSHLCPHCSTDDISLDKLQVQQGFSHIQGELCCLAMLRAICRTVVPSFVAHLFSSDLPGVAFLPHPLAGMLNADETILDPSSSTYFRAINLAS